MNPQMNQQYQPRSQGRNVWGWTFLWMTLLLLCSWPSPAKAQWSGELDARLAHIAEKAVDAGISSYYFLGKRCSLLFIGTHHSFDPQAPLFGVLEQNIEAFAPQAMIVKGGNWHATPTALEAAQRQGEMGYLTHRAKELGIPVRSFEPSESRLREEAAAKHGPGLTKL